MPSDDGTIKLAPECRLINLIKSHLHCEQGRCTSPLGWQHFCKHGLKRCHRMGGLFHVEMSYNSYDFNLPCTLGSWHLFRPTANIRSDCVCSPSFLLVLLLLSSLKGLSRAFHRSPIMTLLKQDYLGVAEALLHICRFTTWDTRVKKKKRFHSVRIYYLFSWFLD